MFERVIVAHWRSAFLYFLAFFFLVSISHAQTYEWAWMGGNPLSAYSSQLGNYGAPGTPAPGNMPGGHHGSVTWVDKQGNLWLFGGEGIDGLGQWGNLNDLWKYSPSTHQWTWVSGSDRISGTIGMPTGPVGVYGTLGVPSPTNVPGGRIWATGSVDADGKLWLFGGQGFDSAGNTGNLNDFWRFDPATSQWTWMGGSSTVPLSTCLKGVYGTIGSPSAQNIPAARFGASAWTDAHGNLWFFGGFGADQNCTQGSLNDLWLYSPSSGEWTWMGGDSTFPAGQSGAFGVYGKLGAFAAGNFPGSRYWSTVWTDKSGNLWLFGGLGYAASTSGYLNDVWEFSATSHQWAWMAGNNAAVDVNSRQTYVPGMYGSLQTPAAGNTPGARYGAAGWTDSHGNLWLFGGDGFDSANILGYLNDLWQFNASTRQWAWMGGSNTVPTDCAFDDNQGGIYGFCGPTGVYGALMTPAFGNFPGGRQMAAAWTDLQGNFWLFGGQGYDSAAYGVLNDLWELPMDSNNLPVAATPTLAPQPGPIATWQDVTISDATPGATILYTVDGGAASQYTGPVPITATHTIQTIATAPGYANSNTAVGAYSATFPKAAPPAFSLADGTYSSTQTVTLSDSTPGARIYYATYTIGPAPSTVSTPYTGPITVSSSVSIVAMAVAPDYLNSDVAVAIYTIWPKPVLGEWAWIGGSKSLPSCAANTGMCAEPGVYGKLGSPAPGNVPGGRLGAVTWTGADGRLWLFGGNGRDANGNIGSYNDLWVWDPSTALWAWMGGSSTFVSFSTGGWGRAGVYGTRGSPSSSNIPGGRQYGAGWTSPDGHLWLFGGQGFDSGGNSGALNDLWEFNPKTNQWTWVSGKATVPLASGNTGIYGTIGVADPANTPGSRYQAQTWTGKDGRFWLYGGNGFNFFGGSDCFNNDMWVFDPATRMWTWMLGQKVCSPNLPVYGALSVPDPANQPWRLTEATTWTDNNGFLWMFGGLGEYIDGTGFYLNELWAYDPSLNQWAWMGGGTTVPYFGTQGVWNPNNTPGTTINANGWTDKQGKFWLFGGWSTENSLLNGAALTVLWQLDPATDEWVWMGGSNSYQNNGWEPGFYGPLASPGLGYTPGGRSEAMSWTDANGNLWLFGGRGVDSVGGFGFLNDLWEFQPSLGVAPGDLHVAAAPTFNPPAGIYQAEQSVILSDTTPGARIYYTTDGSVPTASSTLYTGPITVSVYGTTVSAIALAPKFLPSSVSAATYYIYLPPASLPTFSIPAGTYTTAQTVAISDATPGAVIYYTTDASTPTTASTKYTGPITVSRSQTITAIATADGYSQSAIASADYNIPPNFTLGANPPSVTIPSGSSGNATLTITPENGFNSSVTFDCSGLPAGTTCSFKPATVTPDGKNAATTTITIAASTSASNGRPAGLPMLPGTVALAGLLLFLRKRRTIAGWTCTFVLSGTLIAISACGGGSNPPPPPTTATVTVTAASGAVQQTAEISLTITH